MYGSFEKNDLEKADLILDMSHSLEFTFHDPIGWLYISRREDIYEAYAIPLV